MNPDIRIQSAHVIVSSSILTTSEDLGHDNALYAHGEPNPVANLLPGLG